MNEVNLIREDLRTSRDDQRLITAIQELALLEPSIESIWSIDQLEDIRGRSMGIQTYDRELGNAGEALVAWAKRVAVRIQLQITRIQERKRAKRNGEVISEVPKNGDFAPRLSKTEQNRRGELRAAASLPVQEVEQKLTEGADVRELAAEARARKRGQKPKSTPAQLDAARVRYYRAKAKKQADKPAPLERSPAQKFERYWPNEVKLLREFFTEKDFEKIEFYWTRAFQNYRKEAAERKQERADALANLRNKHRPERLEPITSEA